MVIKESLRDAISHREECRRRSAEACAAGAVDKQTVSELSVGALLPQSIRECCELLTLVGLQR